MKTIVQASVIFILMIMIITTSIGLIAHHSLQSELVSSVSNGVEQTVNTTLVSELYPYDSYDEIISDVLLRIILSKSSKGELVVNIYNKNNLSNGILEIEAIEYYRGLGKDKREASYRVKACVAQADGELKYFKYVEPGEDTVYSEQWRFDAEDISEIKNYLKTAEGAFPSQERNKYFLEHFEHCRVPFS